MAHKRQSAGFHVSYVTITYRSVLMGLTAMFGLALIVIYFAFPDFSNRMILAGQMKMGNALSRFGVGSATASGPVTEPGPQQAHFTNLVGLVRVRKASSNVWLTADYSLALERNDVVQTDGEAMARVVFTDGTSYSVKPGSLIVIQENSVTAQQQTRVAVQVTTGTVDLSTNETLTRGSKSQVIVGDTTANMAPSSAATVVNDPTRDERSVTQTKGTSELTRGTTTVALGTNEKATLPTDSTTIAKSKVIAPPTLMAPKAGDVVHLDPKTKSVSLYWSLVDGAKGYHLKLSKNQFFSGQPVVEEKNWQHLELAVQGLEPGTYFWEVQAVGDNGKESVAADRSSFTIVSKSDSSANLLLDVEPFIQHGHTFEVRGKTEPGARVIVNGQEVPRVSSEGKFTHYTNQLPPGENWITITAQDAKGGYNVVSRPVNIQ
ncbi:MAG TPA: hypothetical protein VE783_00200 [Candidatus Limnocylindrales bacterium]|nr:hypothetical protein [Candidatus Limnocylindrales bacterium]